MPRYIPGPLKDYRISLYLTTGDKPSLPSTKYRVETFSDWNEHTPLKSVCLRRWWHVKSSCSLFGEYDSAGGAR